MPTKIATATLKGLSPYSQSRHHEEPKKSKESAADYEERTWRYRSHFAEDGQIFMPPMAFKMALDSISKYLGTKIPGKANNTYTKHFLAGLVVSTGPILPEKWDEVSGEWFFMNADGVRGSGKRVKRCYPVVREWEVDVEYTIFDDTITQKVFTEMLIESGKFVGLGRFRPEKGGFYGRYTVENIAWS